MTFIGTPAPHSWSRLATGLTLPAPNPDAASNARSSSPATRSSTSGGTASCRTRNRCSMSVSELRPPLSLCLSRSIALSRLRGAPETVAQYHSSVSRLMTPLVLPRGTGWVHPSSRVVGDSKPAGPYSSCHTHALKSESMPRGRRRQHRASWYCRRLCHRLQPRGKSFASMPHRSQDSGSGR